MEESEPWARRSPLPVADGHTSLTTLDAKLTLVESKLRADAFWQAHRAIDRFAAAGGAPAEPRPFKKSYLPRPRRPDDRRVDIEVQAGRAFVAGGAA